MLLLIDAGNTRIKWALVASAERRIECVGQWAVCGSIERERVLLLGDAWQGQRIARALVSNVAGQGVRDSLDQAMLRAFGLKPVPVEWFASVPQLGGLRNGYRNPAQLGCDRFAGAIGARALFPGRPLLIATCGTATTIDAISADGVFEGGMILPGPGLMAASLARNTAQLPQVPQLAAAPERFADNTADAIAAGCLAAQAGAIERAYALHAAADSQRAAQCVLSGGAAAVIAPHLALPFERVDNLVLIGLHAAAMQCKAEPGAHADCP
jgi:type III pantothenate kinase